VSPWALTYMARENSASNACALGATIVLFAAMAMYRPTMWIEAINLLLGAWMIVSPFALRFASDRTAATNAVVVGALVVTFASWTIFDNAEFNEWWHEHHLF
jgi:hypothetical protein